MTYCSRNLIRERLYIEYFKNLDEEPITNILREIKDELSGIVGQKVYLKEIPQTKVG